MTSSRRFSLVWRWSVSAMALTALFWGIWHLATGSVPVVTSLQLGTETAYELPLAVSRWWDVLCAGVWTALFVLVVTSESLRSDDDVVVGLVVGLVFGLAYGLLVGLKYLFRKKTWYSIRDWYLAR